jgi:hypothetical protein
VPDFIAVLAGRNCCDRIWGVIWRANPIELACKIEIGMLFSRPVRELILSANMMLVENDNNAVSQPPNPNLPQSSPIEREASNAMQIDDPISHSNQTTRGASTEQELVDKLSSEPPIPFQEREIDHADEMYSSRIMNEAKLYALMFLLSARIISLSHA